MENTIEYAGPDLAVTLGGIEASIQAKNTADIREILGNTAETFDIHGLKKYFLESRALCTKQEWHENDILRAQSFVLYHIYLMFYREIGTDTACVDFLNRILDRYKQGNIPVQ